MGTGVLARDELARLWWRMPGVEKPRVEGAVDFRGARWVAASTGNWRLGGPSRRLRDRHGGHPCHPGQFGSAVKVFQDPGHGAAAHYIVRKDGRVTQMIRELDWRTARISRP